MRFEFWERRLNAMVDLYRRRVFEWGKFDCVSFAADCCWALTQKNPADGLRGTYTDAEGAAAIIAAHGGLENLVETALARAGLTLDRIKPAFAQRGDICLMGAEGNPAIGVCMGAEVLGMSPTGLERRPLSLATVVWAIR